MIQWSDDPESMMVLAFAVCEPTAVDAAGILLRERLLAAHPLHLGQVECRAFDSAEAIAVIGHLEGRRAAAVLEETLVANPDYALVLGMLIIPTMPTGQA